MFMVVITARPGHTLAEVEAAALEEIARLKSDRPATAEEVARAVNSFESHFIKSLEPISEFGGRADQLNGYNVLTGDPGYLSKDFDRYVKVDPQAVTRVAKKYLGPGRVVVEVTPGPKLTIVPDVLAEAAAAREEMAKEHSRAAAPRPRRRDTATTRLRPQRDAPARGRSRSSICRRSIAAGSPTAWKSCWSRSTSCRW